MNITEVRIKLMEDGSDRLKAFCSITFDDCFVVRDLKIIEGTNGPFVSMPSRKLTCHCSNCHSKNHLRANYCNNCGEKLAGDRAPVDCRSFDLGDDAQHRTGLVLAQPLGVEEVVAPLELARGVDHVPLQLGRGEERVVDGPEGVRIFRAGAAR